MSLAALALRICTVRALRGRTLAGDMVRDSEIGPIDDAAAGKELPFVQVYTDDSSEDLGNGDMLFAPVQQDLVIEIGITTRGKEKRNGNPGDWVVPTTDAGMEFTINAIWRQCTLALADPQNPWAELWRRFVLENGGTRKSQRGASAKDGVRFAGRQIIWPVMLAADPTPGEPLGELWEDFLAACAADADLATLEEPLRNLATGGAIDWPAAKAVRAVHGLAADRARALGYLPPASVAPDEPVFATLALDDVEPEPADTEAVP